MLLIDIDSRHLPRQDGYFGSGQHTSFKNLQI